MTSLKRGNKMLLQKSCSLNLLRKGVLIIPILVLFLVSTTLIAYSGIKNTASGDSVLVSGDKIVKAISLVLPIKEETLSFIISDSVYVVYGSLDTYQILTQCIYTPQHLYEDDYFDCDDYSRITRGCLSEKGFGNMAVFEVHGVMVDGGYLHSMLLVLSVLEDADGDIVMFYVEPQTGEIVDIDKLSPYLVIM